MVAHDPETHHVAPQCLLTLHQKANGTELDGEGIQAWVEWEMEAMRRRVPVEISRVELEALVDRSTAGNGQCVKCPGCRSTKTSLNPMQTISKSKERTWR